MEILSRIFQWLFPISESKPLLIVNGSNQLKDKYKTKNFKMNPKVTLTEIREKECAIKKENERTLDEETEVVYLSIIEALKDLKYSDSKIYFSLDDIKQISVYNANIVNIYTLNREKLIGSNGEVLMKLYSTISKELKCKELTLNINDCKNISILEYYLKTFKK